MANLNVHAERKLLTQCHGDDSDAQSRFALLSYLNQIYKTASEVNYLYNRVLEPHELEALCSLLTTKIYESFESLPSDDENLYQRISDYVFVAVTTYVRGQ